MELSEASLQSQQKHAELLRRVCVIAMRHEKCKLCCADSFACLVCCVLQYEAQQRARSVIVPTAIEDVKAQLRALGHPVTLFGEGVSGADCCEKATP
jgi:hypothetical protein